MENPKTKTATYHTTDFEFANATNSDDVETRLNSLLAIQLDTDREKSLYKSEKERFEASLIKHPIPTDKAFSYFGLLLGTFPPLSLFVLYFLDFLKMPNKNYWVIALLLFVNLVCAAVGYFSGKLIGKMVAETEKWSWSSMLLVSPFIGILWGLMAGGAGGLFIFVIGAIFGAIIASMVGAFALPIFTIFHRWLKKGDVIERNQFLPIAIGITLAISAFFLSLPNR